MLENLFIGINSKEKTEDFIKKIKEFASENKDKQIYIINKPLLTKEIYGYDLEEFIIVLTPGYKILFINMKNEKHSTMFEDYISEIGHLSRKYGYINLLGRERDWINKLTNEININELKDKSINDFLENIDDVLYKRKLKILISLIIGSVNDIDRINGEVPSNLLEQVKKKIILYDSNQTKFIYQEPNKKRITIQGMAGTGKTELLLHKVKDLYVNQKDSKIVMTCFNKVLEYELKQRIPDFFDFLKIEEQIKWNERLWVMRSWGSEYDSNSGIYSYICHKYNIKFQRFSKYGPSFAQICKNTIDELNLIEKFEPCFDYLLIDESQDFSEEFFLLCEKVTRRKVYVAGDIFQDIFDRSNTTELQPDFLLNKCYRTDSRTLMFAHALGMGLLEERYLNWLEDEEWEAVGYKVNKTNNYYNLTREKINRFDEITKVKYESIGMIASEKKNYVNQVINIIDSIIEDYSEVKPDDIGIVFLNDSPEGYKLSDQLGYSIEEKYGWLVTKGYEIKSKQENTLFISNRNNIKGLEFPFVICILHSELDDNIYMRNSIYMMLTRSFIKSYIILPQTDKNIDSLREGMEYINKHNALKVREPSDQEKERIKEFTISKNELKSQEEMILEIISDLNTLTHEEKKKLKNYIIKNINKSLIDRDKIEIYINTHVDFLRSGMI